MVLIISMTWASDAISLNSNFFLYTMGILKHLLDYATICHENKCHNVGKDTVNYQVESKCYSYVIAVTATFLIGLIIWLAVRIFMTDKIWHSFALCSRLSDNSLYVLFLFFFEVIWLALTFNCKTLTSPNNNLFIHSCIHSKVITESVVNTRLLC